MPVSNSAFVASKLSAVASSDCAIYHKLGDFSSQN